ncbi:hypothetical protein ACH49_12160 [Streptomyces leeuwenhoekii]|uniref:Uncharacterized protein n=1 Tax=Streptomyces leeuwenhoekii TaxID=1437453 RepID=A0ABR5HZX3_STRLW|nr:hypothetical protein [Streptomyces leeuwenhoekii]KMS79574.1 hypothetical protein ACH49_12160 [Streptomyces leeuwenhoekii]
MSARDAYERLMAEAIPTGTFGGARPASNRAVAARSAETVPRWTPEEQARHRAELDAALDGWEWDDEYADRRRDRDREYRRDRRVHFRVIDGEAA